MKLLDTNVFVYAQGRPHPYREPCRAVLGQAQERPDAYGVDVEALQELLDVYSRRGQRTLAVEIVNDVLDSLPEPFPITSREIHEVTDIIVAHPGLSPRDAIHGAVVLTYGLEGIVSAEQAFDRVPGLVRFDPLKLAGP